MIGLGILVLAGVTAVNELGTEAAAGNESSMVQTTEKVAMPIFTVLGFLVLLIGAFALLSAFNAI